MFRFSTRDLVWVTLLISVSLGWWRYAGQREARLRKEFAIKSRFDREYAYISAKAGELNQRIDWLIFSRDHLDEQREAEMQRANEAMAIHESRAKRLHFVQDRGGEVPDADRQETVKQWAEIEELLQNRLKGK